MILAQTNVELSKQKLNETLQVIFDGLLSNRLLIIRSVFQHCEYASRSLSICATG